MKFGLIHSFAWRLAMLLTVFFLGNSTSFGDSVIKSENDRREYQSFVLPNQLKVLIVSDPDTDKAAAALDVFVGSSSDPQDRQGLAHFLEHMLFLGTQKYPRPDEYQAFVSTHGGSHNAYTAEEHTNYYFDIDQGYLAPALDRFAQFFVAPLFSPDYVNREKNAVHSEYQSRKKNDGIRLRQAWKEVANPQHPFTKFSVGSLDTLSDREGASIRNELIGFHKRHYSANIMALTVLGREPLPVLRQLVSEKFAAIANTDARPLEVSVPLFAEGQLPGRINVIPLKDRRLLRLTFPIPPLDPHYRAKPVDQIANLLGHEGKGSLFSLLKSKGWADKLSAGPRMNHLGGATFNVSIYLTEAGLEHIDDIGSHVFQYIRLIGRHGITRWIFDEQSRINQIAFRFQEKHEPVEYVRWLASNLQIYPGAEVLRGPYIMDRYDPALTRRFLEKLTPENVLVTVNAPGLPTDATASWFDTPYGFAQLDTDTRTRWQSDAVNPLLAIPEPNELLPEDLAVKPPKQASSHPVRVKQAPGFELWFQQDTSFRVPRADFFISVRSANSNDSPRHAVLTRLYVKLVNDQLNEYYYPAYLAGLKYDLYKHSRGFSVRVSGYNDKQGLLINRIAQALARPVITEAGFALAREELARQLRNVSREPPHRQTLSQVPKLLLEPHWSEVQQLDIVEELTADDLRRFIPDLLGEIDVVVLAHGNLYRDEAIEFARGLEEKLLHSAKPVSVPRNQVVKLPEAKQYVQQLDIDHPDSAIAIYAQGNNKSYATRAKILLTAHVLSAPFYGDLRTDKQLGYVVYVTAFPLLEAPGIAFVIESPTTEPNELEAHVQRFVTSYAETIAQMGDSEFANHKRGLLTRITEDEQQLSERSDRYWREIDRNNYDFDSREQLADASRRIDKDEFVAFYRKFLSGDTGKRLVVRAIGKQHEEAFARNARQKDYIVVSDPDTFKRDKEYFPRFN
ncbi:MAG: insulinase family protein [Gammaproteobacteria bacterium]|nr:insulinase family protein [Gammaproteobacteria bacterium]